MENGQTGFSPDDLNFLDNVVTPLVSSPTQAEIRDQLKADFQRAIPEAERTREARQSSRILKVAHGVRASIRSAQSTGARKSMIVGASVALALFPKAVEHKFNLTDEQASSMEEGISLGLAGVGGALLGESASAVSGLSRIHRRNQAKQNIYAKQEDATPDDLAQFLATYSDPLPYEVPNSWIRGQGSVTFKYKNDARPEVCRDLYLANRQNPGKNSEGTRKTSLEVQNEILQAIANAQIKAQEIRRSPTEMKIEGVTHLGDIALGSALLIAIAHLVNQETGHPAMSAALGFIDDAAIAGIALLTSERVRALGSTVFKRTNDDIDQWSQAQKGKRRNKR